MKNCPVSIENYWSLLQMDASEIISVANKNSRDVEVDSRLEPPQLFRNSLKHKIFSLVTPLGKSKGIYERSIVEK